MTTCIPEVCAGCSARMKCTVGTEPSSKGCRSLRIHENLSPLVVPCILNPPPPPAPKKCEHEYVLLSSVYRVRGRGDEYERVDEFYCKKCLDIKSKTRTHYGGTKPDWWNS